MGRISKVVLLALLLIFSGVPGIAPLLCAQPLASHAHSCCAAHKRTSSANFGSAATLSDNPPCCNVAPARSMPIQPLLLLTGSHDGEYGLQAASDLAVALPAPILLSGRGSPRSAKLLHSPVQAVLCTFLV